jgi:predicted SnoaL-like aldol condensation-catalyzing enzyme
MDKRNFDIADELVAADYIDHNPPLPGTAPGREGVKQANAMLYAAFPDARHAIEDQIAEGDKVVTRLTTTVPPADGCDPPARVTLHSSAWASRRSGVSKPSANQP